MEEPLAAWGRLWRTKAADREHRSTCWRVLHCSLLVGAVRVHRDGTLPHTAAHCTLPECAAAGVGGGPCLDTITHALMHCPAAAPVVDWALRLWAALTPGRPQPLRCPQLLLADQRTVWQPSEEHAVVWMTFRVTLLGCLWRCRCRRRAWEEPSAAACALRASAEVVDHLTEAMQRDWARCKQDVRQLSEDVPSDWFRGRQHAMSTAAFVRQWGMGGRLCRVEDDGQRLVVELSHTHPVPVPGLPGPAGLPG